MSTRWKCVCGKESPLTAQRCPNCQKPLSMYGRYVSDEPEPEIPFRPFVDTEENENPKKATHVPQKKTPKEPKQRKPEKKKRKNSGGQTILILLLLLIILLMGALIVFLLGRIGGQKLDPALLPVQTTPVDTLPDPTVPADTQPVPTDSPATDPPAIQPPATDPPVEDGPWMNNILSKDFRVADYSLCSYIGYTYSRYYPATHVVFVDNLKGLQNTRNRYVGYAGNTNLVDAAWDVSEAQDGSVWAWYGFGHPADVESCDGQCDYILYIGAEGGVNGSLACPELFARCTELEYIDFRGCFHTVGATSMEKMFYNCEALHEIDVCCFNTSDVTNMSNMFYGINASCKITIDLNRFNTAKVTAYNNFMYYGDTINGVPWTDLFK